PRLTDKFTDEPDHSERMNVISDLFPFVAKDLVGLLFEIALDEITEEPLQLYPRVFPGNVVRRTKEIGPQIVIDQQFLHLTTMRAATSLVFLAVVATPTNSERSFPDRSILIAISSDVF